MCEQTMPYSVGTLLWFKTPRQIWWPAKVVDASTVPEDQRDYDEKMEKYILAFVCFITENKYAWPANMNNVCLYSSPKKMNFIEKGYSMYLKQKKGASFTYNMEYFIKDVKHFESESGGNENIFDELDRIITHRKTDTTKRNKLIKELFKTSKQTKKSVRKSMTTTTIAKPKLKSTIQKCKNQIESKKWIKVRNGRKENKKIKSVVDNIIEDWSDHSDNGQPGSEDINTLSEQKDALNKIFDFDENECEKVFDRLRGNNENVECCIGSKKQTIKDKQSKSTVKTRSISPEVQNNQMFSMFGKIQTEEWVKNNPWATLPGSGMDEARKYASMIMNMSIMSSEPPDLTLMPEEEPPFKAQIFCGAPYNENPINFEILQVPIVPPKYTDEELVKLPEFKMLRELIDSGQQNSVTVTINGAKIIHNPLDTFNFNR